MQHIHRAFQGGIYPCTLQSFQLFLSPLQNFILPVGRNSVSILALFHFSVRDYIYRTVAI